MVKILGSYIDLEYAKSIDEGQFKSEFLPIYSPLYISEAWAEVEKIKEEGAKASKKAK